MAKDNPIVEAATGNTVVVPTIKGGIDPTLIAELIAGSRGRNMYGPKLVEFCDSDEPAIDVVEAWPMEFNGKESTTLYQGFRLAAEKAQLLGVAENGKPAIPAVLRIVQRNGNVYLLHNERVSLVQAQAATTEVEEVEA